VDGGDDGVEQLHRRGARVRGAMEPPPVASNGTRRSWSGGPGRVEVHVQS
jgi:hypothetical protein